MPSKFHDEGLRISAMHRRKVLLECPPSNPSCASTIVKGSTCLAPSEPCPPPPPYATKCKPYWAEFDSNYIHESLRPFITSTQVHEVRPSGAITFLRRSPKLPRIEFRHIQEMKNIKTSDGCPPVPRLNKRCAKPCVCPGVCHRAEVPCKYCHPPISHGRPCYPKPCPIKDTPRPGTCPPCNFRVPVVYNYQPTTCCKVAPRISKCVEFRGQPCKTHMCSPDYFVRFQGYDLQQQW